MNPIGAVGVGYRPPWTGDAVPATAAGAGRVQHASAQTLAPAGERVAWLTPEDFLPDPPADADWEGAEGAFARLLQRLYAAGERLGAEALRPPSQFGVTDLASLEKLDPSTLVMVASMISMQAMGDTAKSTQRALALLAERQDRLRQEDIQKFREQMEAMTRDADKARKGGVFGVIFDWITAAVDLVVGALKVVTGVLTMNPLMIAGGVADLGAGIAGVGAAIMKTMALADPKNAEHYEREAAKWGHAQMAFQALGMVVSFGISVRGFMASRSVAKTATRMFRGGAGDALASAVKAGDDAAINAIRTRVVSEVSYQIGAEVGRQVGRSLAQSGTRTARSLAARGFNRMAEQFTQQMMEQMVTRAFDNVVKSTSRQLARGVTVSAAEVTKSLGKQLASQGRRAVARGMWSLSSVLRGALVAGREITASAIGMQRARLQLDARDLATEMSWLQFLMALNGDDKKRIAKRMEALAGQQGDVAEAASEAVTRTGAVRIRIAASMA
ncbi:type III secretion system translocon subunit SctE [Pandoraea sp. CB10b_02]|uniref:type III secretion system translocon subunit SctE n=1 Tax=Pandoraea sp. CB10b_02 TaxID=2014535 RepID=UPI002580A297|nr:type III secretion system translocon subunit SctE [Pandoraea sp. CB10b_02]